MNIFIYIYYKTLDCYALAKVCDSNGSKIVRKVFKVMFFTYLNLFFHLNLENSLKKNFNQNLFAFRYYSYCAKNIFCIITVRKKNI